MVGTRKLKIRIELAKHDKKLAKWNKTNSKKEAHQGFSNFIKFLRNNTSLTNDQVEKLLVSVFFDESAFVSSNYFQSENCLMTTYEMNRVKLYRQYFLLNYEYNPNLSDDQVRNIVNNQTKINSKLRTQASSTTSPQNEEGFDKMEKLALLP